MLSSLNLLSPRNMFVSSGIHLSSILNIQLFNLTHLLFLNPFQFGLCYYYSTKNSFFSKIFYLINILCVCVKDFLLVCNLSLHFLDCGLVCPILFFFSWFFLKCVASKYGSYKHSIPKIFHSYILPILLFFISIALNFYFKIHLLNFPY